MLPAGKLPSPTARLFPTDAAFTSKPALFMKNPSFEFFANGTCKVDRLYLMTLLEDFQGSLSSEAAALLARNDQLLYEEWCARWAEQFLRPDAFGPPLLRLLTAIQRLAQRENQPILEEALSHLPPGYEVKRSLPALHQATALWVIARNTPGVTFPVVEERGEREERQSVGAAERENVGASERESVGGNARTGAESRTEEIQAEGGPDAEGPKAEKGDDSWPNPSQQIERPGSRADELPLKELSQPENTAAAKTGTDLKWTAVLMAPDAHLEPAAAIVSTTGSGNEAVPSAGPKAQARKLLRESDFLPLSPWPEPVDARELLDELVSVYGRIAILPRYAAEVLALFSVHSYCWELRDVTVYLAIESPVRRCGKTTLLAAIRALVNRPAAATQASPSSVYRLIAAKKPVFILDQAEKALTPNQALYSIFNTSYTRPMAYVLRTAAQCKKNKPAGSDASRSDAPLTPEGLEPDPVFDDPDSEWRRFPCWCPKVMALVGHFDETLADRCLLLTMQRKHRNQKCARLRDIDTASLKRKCIRFVLDHQEQIANAGPAIPDDLNDRAADIWEVLFAIAELAGDDWSQHARQAAVALAQQAEEGSLIGGLLLDLVGAFIGFKTDRLFSRDLVAWLNGLDDRPWKALTRGRPVTEQWLAGQLKEFEVRPRAMRVGGELAKGYLRDDVAEVARRYSTKADVEALLGAVELDGGSVEA